MICFHSHEHIGSVVSDLARLYCIYIGGIAVHLLCVFGILALRRGLNQLHLNQISGNL